MLVIKVEVWPNGRESGAREIARAGAANVSDMAELSDYQVVRVDERGERADAWVVGHRREDGPWPLVAAAASAVGDVGSELADRIAARLGPVHHAAGSSVEMWRDVDVTLELMRAGLMLQAHFRPDALEQVLDRPLPALQGLSLRELAAVDPVRAAAVAYELVGLPAPSPG